MITATLGGDTVTIHDSPTLDLRAFAAWNQGRRAGKARLLGLDIESRPLDHEDRQNSYGPQRDRWLRLFQVADEHVAWNLDTGRPDHRAAAIDLARDPFNQFTSWSGIDPETLINCLGVDITPRYYDAQTLSLLLKPGQMENHKLKEWAARYGMPELRAAEGEQAAHWATLAVPAPRKPARPRRRKGESDDQYTERLYQFRTATMTAWRKDVDAYYQTYPLRESDRETSQGGFKMGWSGWRDVPVTDPLYQKYGGLDAIAVRRLWPILVEEVKVRGVYRAARQQELPLQQFAVRLRHRGVLCDREYAQTELDIVRPVHLAAKEEFQELTGLKAGSPKRIEWFEGRGVVSRGKTKTGAPSLGQQHVKDLIARYAPEEPGGAPLCDPEAYRALELVARAAETQNMTTFVGGILEFMDPHNRIHPNYRVLGANTGRWTVNNPAVQTFSNKNNSRGIIVAEPDHLWVSIDQAQIEVRVFAALAEEGQLIDAFNQGRDIYGSVATRIFGAGYTKKQRALCKRIVLGGCLFGGGADQLVTQLHDVDGVVVRREEVVKTKRDFLEAYPRGRQYLRRMNSTDDVWLDSGRFVPGDPDRPYRGTNSACQGTARDLLVQTLFRVFRSGYEEMVRLAVHDEVLFSVPIDRADKILTDLKACFTVPFRGVNVDCDVEVSPVRWGQDVRTWAGPGDWVATCAQSGCKSAEGKPGVIHLTDPKTALGWRCTEHRATVDL